MSKVVALETAEENITCNSICPGFVLTELIQDQIDVIAKNKRLSNKDAEIELLKEKQPSLNFVKKEQISKLIYFYAQKRRLKLQVQLYRLMVPGQLNKSRKIDN